MDNAKHTPGPWTARRHGDDPGNIWSRVEGANGANVCTFHGTPQRSKSEEEADANANLIAAAPDLLAALEDTLEGILTRPHEQCNMSAATWEWFQRCRTAIAKAKGQP